MKKKVLIFVCCAIAVIIAVVLIVRNIVIPDNKYKQATSLFERGDYAGAVEAFTALGDYKDSKDQIAEAQKKLEFQIAQQNLDSYNSATSMADIGSYSDAYKIFENLGDYNDSTKKSEEMRTARFEEGKELFDDEKYDKSYDVFSEVARWTYHEEYAEVDELEPAYYAAESLFCLGQFEDAYNAFMKLGDYSDSVDAAQRCLDELAYRDALGLYEKENYEDAKKAFDNLGDYKESGYYSKTCAEYLTYNSLMTQVEETEEMEDGSDDQKEKLKGIFDGFIGLGNMLDSQEQAYQIAEKFYGWEDYDTCAEMYSALGDYSDCAEKMVEANRVIKYREANDILESAKTENDDTKKKEEYEAAMNAFKALDGYKDSEEQFEACKNEYMNIVFEKVEVGGTIVFGKYEIDNDTSNGKEDIEWIILDVKDKKALIISKYALVQMEYNSDEGSVTWETSSLRKWLNNAFMNDAFDTVEVGRIIETTVTADKNYTYGTDPGNDTEDKVFLLSIEEAKTLFSSDGERKCEKGYNFGGRECSWWLRSPGDENDCAAIVYSTGAVFDSGSYVSFEEFVRPALWIDLES